MSSDSPIIIGKGEYVRAEPIIHVGINDNSLFDAFGRQRYSLPISIFDSKQLHDKQSLFWSEQVNNGGSSAYSSGDAGCIMLASQAGESVIRQTKSRFNYQPGKSQNFIMTGLLGSGVNNLIRRIGCYDENNGMFFQSSGNEISVNIRKQGIDTKVNQSNWNVDKLYGDGPSETNIDFNKVQIFNIDYQWLGIGNVRFGLAMDGDIHYCHIAQHANRSTSVYTRTPNLPIRYENISLGGSGELLHICSTVLTEGGFSYPRHSRSVSTGATFLSTPLSGVNYTILALRLKDNYLDSTIIPEQINVLTISNTTFKWTLSLNPTISGSLVYNDINNSAIQWASGGISNIINNLGTILHEGYVGAVYKSDYQLENALDDTLNIGSEIDGTRDILVLSVTPITTNNNICAAIGWKE